ncbi:MAG: prepilin-type N-terminal cleavage/methylation domain-containing protein [Planctomycetota bacterium]
MNTNRRGFTIVELMVTIGIITIVILGVGVALVDSQRGYHKMYDQVHGEVASDSYVAKIVFDKVIRKSSKKKHMLGTQNIVVFYYESLTSPELDRYANFRLNGATLFVDYGPVDALGNPLRPSTTMTLARNVELVEFSVDGAAVRMMLKLNDGRHARTITCTAVRHNE